MKKNLHQKTVERAGKTLTAADLLSVNSIVLRAVPVVTPEWEFGSQVFVAELTADERDQYETDWAEYKQDSEDNVGFRAFTVAYCLCDAERNRLFPTADDVIRAAEILGQRNGKATARIFNACSRINGLTKADIDALEGNSEATQPETDGGSGESLSD